MKPLYPILTLLVLSSLSYGQSLLQWSETYDIKLPYYFSDNPQLEVDDNGLITVIGRCNTSNGQSLLKIQYDMYGDTISTVKFGLDSINDNSVMDYEIDSAGNLYLLSTDKLEYYKSRILLHKYSDDGTFLWVKKIQNPADTSYTAVHLGLLSDTCLLIIGVKEYDYPPPGSHVVSTVSIPYLYAYSIAGNKLWQRKFDESQELNYFMHDILTRNDTAYIFGGLHTLSHKLFKITADMNIQPVLSLNLQKGINHIEFTPDNNLVIASESQYRITKLGLNGKNLWTVFYGTNLPSNVSGDEIRALQQDSAGNIYITGRHYGDHYGTSAYSNADILTLKYDANGQLKWQNRYEYQGNNADIANCLRLKHGEVYVGGNSQANGISTEYNYVLLKIDTTHGKTSGEYRYDEAGGDDAVTSVRVLNDKRVLLTGLTFNGSTYSQTTQLLGATFATADLATLPDVEIYPNPISSGSELKLQNSDYKEYQIITPDGRMVSRGKLEPERFHSIYISELPAGTYFLKLTNGKITIHKKFVVVDSL